MSEVRHLSCAGHTGTRWFTCHDRYACFTPVLSSCLVVMIVPFVMSLCLSCPVSVSGVFGFCRAADRPLFQVLVLSLCSSPVSVCIVSGVCVCWSLCCVTLVTGFLAPVEQTHHHSNPVSLQQLTFQFCNQLLKACLLWQVKITVTRIDGTKAFGKLCASH